MDIDAMYLLQLLVDAACALHCIKQRQPDEESCAVTWHDNGRPGRLVACPGCLVLIRLWQAKDALMDLAKEQP